MTKQGEHIDPIYFCTYDGEDYAVSLSKPTDVDGMGMLDRVLLRLPACPNRTKPIRIADYPHGYFRQWRKDSARPMENLPEGARA